MSMDNAHLDLPIPAGIREEWALQLAELPLPREDIASEKAFVLRLGGEWFGFPPQLIASSRLDVTPRKLPHRANSVVEGLINADGRVIPCFSFDKIFGVLPSQGRESSPRLLIVHWRKWTFAFRSPEVLGLRALNFSELQPLPESSPTVLRNSARGILLFEGKPVVCLDAETLMKHLMEAIS